jgi:predicted permease
MRLILLVLFYVIFPSVIVFGCQRYSILEKMGPVVLSYIIGFAIGNARLLPAGAEKVQNLIATLTIPIALPLLLFSMDVKKWQTA